MTNRPMLAVTAAMSITVVACVTQGEDAEPPAASSSPPAVESTDSLFIPVETPAPDAGPSTLPSTSTTTTVPPSTTTSLPPTTTTSTTTTTTTSTTTTSTTTVPAPVGPVACPPTGSEIWELRPPSDLPPPAPPAGWTSEVIGSSVQGRDIVALVRAVDEPRRRVVVIGGIHGNEPVSPPTVRGLVTSVTPDDVEVWLVPEANPDGVAAGMRCNANGVDLNRNFSWGWRPDDGGPAALSEPEPQALVGLVERLRPDLVVWVHQPYGYASSIGPTPDALEEAWAFASGVPVRRDVTQHGGGESWTALVAGTPSMLIEIDSWAANQETVDRHRAGFEATVAALG